MWQPCNATSANPWSHVFSKMSPVEYANFDAPIIIFMETNCKKSWQPYYQNPSNPVRRTVFKTTPIDFSSRKTLLAEGFL